MKKSLLAAFLAMILVLSGCSRHEVNEGDRLQAMEEITACKKVADAWLSDYRERGYSHLATLESLAALGYGEGQIQALIREKESLYGRIISRKLLGCNLYREGRLISWAPDVEAKDLLRLGARRTSDGLYEIDRRHFSLLKNELMMRYYPPGKYMILLYETTTERRPKVNEGIVLWAGKDRDWQIVLYNIGDDI